MADTPIASPDANSSGKVVGGLAPNVAAMLACIFSVIGGLLFLVLERRNKFVRFYAMQSLLLGLLAFIVAMVFGVAEPVLGFLPIIGRLMKAALSAIHSLFGLVWFVVYLICIFKAFTKVEWEIPWLGKFARRQLAKMDREQIANP